MINRGVSSSNLIFIVAYNHEKYIEKVVARIPASVLENPANELLIIDDASKDSTFFVSDVIREKLKGRAKITVLKNPVNQGYGGNQKLGYRYALDNGFDRVLMVHGDGQYAPESLEDLIKEYDAKDQPDAVFGTRMHSLAAAYRGGMPLYKILGNKILTCLQNILLRSTMSEFHSGCRSYSTRLLKKIPFEVNSNDFHFDTEIIIQCLAAKARIVEIPIPTHYGDEVCHVNGMAYAWNILMASFHYRIQLLGFFYDKKFDIQAEHYPKKESPYSSHSRIISHVKPRSRVLDIGCGMGHISKKLIEKGCVVDGIDTLLPSVVPSGLKQYFQIDLNRDREKLAGVLRQNEYDVIVLGDVLEHLVDPENMLDVIRSWHHAGARPLVVASTPNVAFFIIRMMLAIGQFNYGVRGILDRTHTRLFTFKSFKRLFDQCSYVRKKCEGIPMPFAAILGEKSGLALFLEKSNLFLIKIRPRLFSYQVLIVAEPLPTTNQILKTCGEHSDKLRSQIET